MDGEFHDILCMIANAARARSQPLFFSTTSPLAQKYFDQGLAFTYGDGLAFDAEGRAIELNKIAQWDRIPDHVMNWAVRIDSAH